MVRSDTHRKFPSLIAVAVWSTIVSSTLRPRLFVANRCISSKFKSCFYLSHVMLNLGLPDHKVYNNKALINAVETQH